MCNYVGYAVPHLLSSSVQVVETIHLFMTNVSTETCEMVNM